jgi:hypothetical protein
LRSCYIVIINCLVVGGFIPVYIGNYGGAISMRSNNLNGKFTRLIFTANVAGVAGGAIHSALRNSNMLMTEISVIANTARSYAGGIYFGNDHKNMSMVGGRIADNSAQNAGGIYVSQFNTNFKIAQLIFVNNYAKVDGGGLIVYANLIFITDCVFIENYADNNCGGLYVGEASLGDTHSISLSNCSFVENTAYDSHGGLQITDRHGVTISSSNFEENHAKVGVGGGLTISACTAVYVENTNIVGNDCFLGGAGLNLLGIENFTVFNAIIDNNRAIRGVGGGMRTQMTSGLQLLNVSMTQNFAYTEGGGMHVSGVQIQHLNMASDTLIRDSIIDNNIASEGSGSAIWISRCFLEVMGNSFSNNRASKGGGTLYWSHSSGMAEPTSSGNLWSTSNYGLYGSKWATEATQFFITRDDDSFSVTNPLNVTAYDTEIPYFLVSLVDFYGQLIMNNNQTMVDISVPSYSECTDYQHRYNLSAYVAGR